MRNLSIIILAICTLSASAQMSPKQETKTTFDHKYRVSMPLIIVPQFFTKSWDDRTNTQHVELHFKYELDAKNIIGVKFATWRLFQPMGIQWTDGLLDKVESGTEYYPGHLRETGVGVSYQRMLWKGLFTTAEVLPQLKTYVDLDNNKIGNGFKLYTSLHLGYHLAFGKKKQFFVEPQIHCQTWLIDTNTPAEFQKMDNQWNNYFLFEPNLYFGVKF
jgi:hypothetical protein